MTLPPLGERFPRISLHDALAAYRDEGGVDETSEPDLSPAGERWLSTVWAPKHHNCGFVMVTDYPTSKRPFYAMRDPKDPTNTITFDLVGFGSEIISGGMRINRYDEQVQALKDKGLDPAQFEDYLTMHKFGIPPKAGSAWASSASRKTSLVSQTSKKQQSSPATFSVCGHKMPGIRQKWGF